MRSSLRELYRFVRYMKSPAECTGGGLFARRMFEVFAEREGVQQLVVLNTLNERVLYFSDRKCLERSPHSYLETSSLQSV